MAGPGEKTEQEIERRIELVKLKDAVELNTETTQKILASQEKYQEEIRTLLKGKKDDSKDLGLVGQVNTIEESIKSHVDSNKGEFKKVWTMARIFAIAILGTALKIIHGAWNSPSP